MSFKLARAGGVTEWPAVLYNSAAIITYRILQALQRVVSVYGKNTEYQFT